MSIILYRGDFEKIEKFEICETNKNCAVGRGIYLTNNKDVANSYRTKGSDHHQQNDIIWSGKATNRNHAYQLAFMSYVAAQLGFNATHGLYGDSEKTVSKNCESFLTQYNRDVCDGIVKADYWGAIGNMFNVRYNRPITHGHLSAFNFKAMEFNQSMFMVDNVISDTFFWELVWDNEVDFGERIASFNKDSFIKHNSTTVPRLNITGGGRATITMRIKQGARKEKAWIKLSKLLQPYGYKGFEYIGGNRTGALLRHRAFAIWDDEWVNAHRIY